MTADEAAAAFTWVVTEYGAVNLLGLTLRQRAAAMIGIAYLTRARSCAATSRRPARSP